ncbi:hypothetical protein QKU48_gp1060 [Fadolivirus algeromassiliense]|jgi:hypothetical protein|uniref:Uncharacterized protein n=1 Tax=Fadolivirus FV1/VV64 TaxID=3070911 RepID=A0A7D3R2H6_9VIRU|nr:hypothetical protein QKU48_gp1060 [Fadolivirus algeromassiliense]QKF94518.1 hypothetical protein Fadolivirus_1_1060 [Fadolivirus FV1/VV64]
MQDNSNVWKQCIDKIIEIVQYIIDDNDELVSFEEGYRSVYNIVQIHKKSSELAIALDNVFKINNDRMTKEKEGKINDILMYMIRSTKYQYLYNYDTDVPIDEKVIDDKDVIIQIDI